MQLRSCCPGPGAGFPVERGGPLLGRRGALQPSSAAQQASQREYLGVPAVDLLPRAVFTLYYFRL